MLIQKMDKLEMLASSIMDDELDAAITERAAQIREMSEEAPPRENEDNSKKGHRQRVRERFLRVGLEGFADHEIIELLLFYCIPYKDTKQTAYALLKRFGSISGILDADVSELVKIPGITENTAVLFRLIPQMVSVYYRQSRKNTIYNNTTVLSDMFRPYFVGAGENRFMLACFDGDLHMISIAQVSEPRNGSSEISFRRILSEALNDKCRMAALAHNHPMSSPKPSDEDVAVTRKIGNLLKEIDVRLMDHIIIGGDKTYSMRDGGELGIFD